MKLLKFVLIAVLFITATSAQGNIPEDIQNIINNVAISANNFVTQVSGGLNAAVSDALAAWQTYWNTYSTLRIPLTNVYLVSQQLVQIVNNAVTNIRAALTDNTVFQTALANSYQNAQNVYQEFLEIYYNVTSQGAINCWLTARPQVLYTLENFVNNTARERVSVVADYRTYIFQENVKLIANFTAYQAALPLSCVVLPWRLAACRDNYWNTNAPAINAAFTNYRYNVLTKKNETLVALDQILQTNGQTARTELQRIATDFQACVDALTTTAP